MNRLLATVAGTVIAVALVSSTVFVVDQQHYAVMVSLGSMGKDVLGPGIGIKAPPPLQSVVYLDKRLQALDAGGGERFLTAERKELLVDAFVKWRIVNPRQYAIAFGTTPERGGERLGQVVRNALATEIARRNAADVLAGGKRADVAAAVRRDLGQEAHDIGVEIADLHIKRVDLPETIAGVVYERMKAERLRRANEVRAAGAAEAEQIRSDAERQRGEILTTAQRDAETIKGEGDAQASQIYAQSYGKNPEFYRFYRSLEAYKATFKGRNDVLVLDSNSEFFKYFRNPAPAK